MNRSTTSIIDGAIKNLGFASLNAMQSEMLKISRTNRQVFLFSPTGSGKTVAFLLAALGKVSVSKTGIDVLIIVPSRELALQIEHVFKSMRTGLKVSSCYGGHQLKTEINNLAEIPVFLIGTPGRILYHLEKGTITTETLSVLILDEYDKSLEFGFERELSAILSFIANPKLEIFTSATKPASVPEFVKIANPAILDFTGKSKLTGIEFRLIRSVENDKLSPLLKILAGIREGLTLVFCNHRDAVERISILLHENEIFHDTYHGGYEQAQRERALIKFRNGSTPVLVTTDLASRGLDISGVKNIIHYQGAQNESVFIHRNGRTARMDKEGTIWIVLSSTETIPDFVPKDIVEVTLSEASSPQLIPYFSTLYFGAGKKDKIRKTDIVGLLIQKGGLKKEDVGLVDISDFESFAAVPTEKISILVKTLSTEKIKNRRIKIACSE